VPACGRRVRSSRRRASECCTFVAESTGCGRERGTCGHACDECVRSSRRRASECCTFVAESNGMRTQTRDMRARMRRMRSVIKAKGLRMQHIRRRVHGMRARTWRMRARIRSMRSVIKAMGFSCVPLSFAHPPRMRGPIGHKDRRIASTGRVNAAVRCANDRGVHGHRSWMTWPLRFVVHGFRDCTRRRMHGPARIRQGRSICVVCDRECLTDTSLVGGSPCPKMGAR